MSTNPRTPMLLPWLAKKAGISEPRAEALWHTAEGRARREASPGSAAYWKSAVDYLLQLVAAESLREDVASFGLRPWVRSQARLWGITMQWAQEGSALMTRGWNLLGSAATSAPRLN